MNWRLLRGPWTDPHKNVLLEEAILNLTEEGASPWTLRLWVNGRSVIVGAYQGFGDVRTEFCLRKRIPVLRRVTGGGTVYHDHGNLNWSLFAPRRLVGSDIHAVYRTLSNPVVNALKKLGVDAEFSPPNSVRVRGFKVSGMAAYVKKRVVLCHGTLLIDADLECMTKAIRVRDRVANVSSFVEQATVEGVEKAVEKSFSEIFGVELTEQGPTERELDFVRSPPVSFRSSRLL